MPRLPTLSVEEARIAPGSVPRDLKWLAAHVVSVSAGCQYCAAHTGENTVISDMPAEKVEAVWEYETSDLFTDAERIVLKIAQCVAQVPTDEDFEELRHHWDDEQVVEIVAAISTFGFFNRWNDTLATELEASPLQFAQDHLSDAGWSVGKHAAE